MREAPTEAELRLWRLLRDRRLNSLKFRRQVPVGPYIVDFLCVGAKLIIKADGLQHAESPRDNARDAYLESQGWKVLRFWNNEVFLNPEGVLETILAHADLTKQSEPSSGPSGHLPRGRRGAEWRLAPGDSAGPNASAETPSPSGGRWRAEGATDEGKHGES